MKPEILFEDSEILVCHKPAGMAVQTASFSSQDMVSLLKNHLMREARKSGTPLKGAPYLAVIHRLDQPVEGILVFGKTKKAAAALNTQLTGDGFGKYYEAVTEGAPTESSGTLTDWLVRDGRTNLSSVCSPDTPDAKKARPMPKRPSWTTRCWISIPGTGGSFPVCPFICTRDGITRSVSSLPMQAVRFWGTANTIRTAFLPADSISAPAALIFCIRPPKSRFTLKSVLSFPGKI